MGKIENLNLAPMSARKHVKSVDFHFRKGTKVKGKETDVYKCNRCQETFPPTAFHLHNLKPGGVYGLSTKCRQCQSSEVQEVKLVRKKASPRPENCDCCHKGGKKLQPDHLHGTTMFRGWLCRNCNTGIGLLGDTLEGILRSTFYLEKDRSKIIEILNGIKNQME